jgi:hypothetical protein
MIGLDFAKSLIEFAAAVLAFGVVAIPLFKKNRSVRENCTVTHFKTVFGACHG